MSEIVANNNLDYNKKKTKNFSIIFSLSQTATYKYLLELFQIIIHLKQKDSYIACYYIIEGANSLTVNYNYAATCNNK